MGILNRLLGRQQEDPLIQKAKLLVSTANLVAISTFTAEFPGGPIPIGISLATSRGIDLERWDVIVTVAGVSYAESLFPIGQVTTEKQLEIACTVRDSLKLLSPDALKEHDDCMSMVSNAAQGKLDISCSLKEVPGVWALWRLLGHVPRTDVEEEHLAVALLTISYSQTFDSWWKS